METSEYRFFSDFDSGNLAEVEEVSVNEDEIHEAEFQVWTKPDCFQTEFQAGNTGTWFYFGMAGGQPGALIKFNIMNIGRQTSLFSQGMKPVCLVTSESDEWKRINDDPIVTSVEDGCVLSFMFRNPKNTKKETFLALTYPYKFEELQETLDTIEESFNCHPRAFKQMQTEDKTDIYIHRETVIKSLENRNLDLLTITDMNGLQEELEDDLQDLFPDETNRRPHMFDKKEIVFVSSRVHPGETCASYVMKGFINFLLRKDDVQATKLREKYVFKIVPMLNPDGVANGHYRNDTRGVNLNRVYGNPTKEHSPTIFAAKKLIDYYHSLNQNKESPTSNIFLYTDIHGHATERGIFMYGNHSEDNEFKVQTLLYPKLLAINNPNFSFASCKTANMTLQDLVSGTNADGCGRAYAHRATGLAQAYTLECSFNGGDNDKGEKEIYTPEVYEDFGKSLAVSILDLTESNPRSKVQDTPLRNLAGVKMFVAKKIKAAQLMEASRKFALGKLMNYLSMQNSKTTENNKYAEVEDSGQHDTSRRRSSGAI
eukprot:GFUD01028433.1.p1 GENE.GFUD01028433.1~~GFUD01028433.1.p1  ORF type:complete len:549 (+),score=113.91 GFUD01028433.1:26-1648(+)